MPSHFPRANPSKYLSSAEVVVVVSVLVEEEARLNPELVDEMVSEAVVVRQPHRTQLCPPAFLQIPGRKGYTTFYP